MDIRKMKKKSKDVYMFNMMLVKVYHEVQYTGKLYFNRFHSILLEYEKATKQRLFENKTYDTLYKEILVGFKTYKIKSRGVLHNKLNKIREDLIDLAMEILTINSWK